VYMLRRAGLASCRRRPLSSNVRPHTNTECRHPPASETWHEKTSLRTPMPKSKLLGERPGCLGQRSESGHTASILELGGPMWRSNAGPPSQRSRPLAFTGSSACRPRPMKNTGTARGHTWQGARHAPCRSLVGCRGLSEYRKTAFGAFAATGQAVAALSNAMPSLRLR
jgi:hypothetical protein